MNEIMKTILHRHTIRRFDTKQIKEEALQQILQAGLYAPSAGGRQDVIFTVCQDKEVNERLEKIKRANSNPYMATATSWWRIPRALVPVISGRAGVLLQTLMGRKS